MPAFLTIAEHRRSSDCTLFGRRPASNAEARLDRPDGRAYASAHNPEPASFDAEDAHDDPTRVPGHDRGRYRRRARSPPWQCRSEVDDRRAREFVHQTVRRLLFAEACPRI